MYSAPTWVDTKAVLFIFLFLYNQLLHCNLHCNSTQTFTLVLCHFTWFSWQPKWNFLLLSQQLCVPWPETQKYMKLFLFELSPFLNYLQLSVWISLIFLNLPLQPVSFSSPSPSFSCCRPGNAAHLLFAITALQFAIVPKPGWFVGWFVSPWCQHLTLGAMEEVEFNHCYLQCLMFEYFN